MQNIIIFIVCSLLSSMSFSKDSLANRALQELLNGRYVCDENCIKSQKRSFITCKGKSYGGWIFSKTGIEENEWSASYKLTVNDVNTTIQSTSSPDSYVLFCEVSEERYVCRTDYTQDAGLRTVLEAKIDRISGEMAFSNRMYAANNREKQIYRSNSFGQCEKAQKPKF